MVSLNDAKSSFVRGVIDGAECPCCGRYAKLNKVCLTKAMILGLSWIAKKSSTGGWAFVQEHGPDWMKRSNSHAKMIHWGLVERKPVDDASKKHSGIYRVTEKGLQFLSGEIKVKKYMLIYNNISLSPDGFGEEVSASDCIGVDFDYKKDVVEA